MGSTTSLLSLLCYTLLISSTFSELCNPQYKKVLLQIKQAFNNPYVLASWDPNTDCCDRYCVTCDSASNRINYLPHLLWPSLWPNPTWSGWPLFSRHSLISQVSQSHWSYPTCHCQTTVHRSWTCLRNLLEFNLSKVVLAKRLIALDLNQNKIYGSIPVEITALKLQFFNVSYNRLCGQIPIGGKLQIKLRLFDLFP